MVHGPVGIERWRGAARAARERDREAQQDEADAGRGEHGGQRSRSTASTLGVVRGALRQLVRASRFVARVRPTIERSGPGRGCHCDHADGARTVPLTPTRDQTGGHLGCRSRNQGRTIGLEADSSRRISDLDHEPSNWTFDHQAWVTVGTAALIGIHQRQDRPPVSEGDRAFPADRRRCDQAERPRRSTLTWARRATPRTSRSAWITRAASTRSGSWLTVLATQSM